MAATQITGGVTAVGHWAEELVFLTNTQELAPGKSGGKLKGKQSWPFSLSLPTTEIPVAEKPKAKAELFSLPPTFTGLSTASEFANDANV